MNKITVVNKYTAPLLNGKPRASSTERTCRRNVSRIGGGGGGGGGGQRVRPIYKFSVLYIHNAQDWG